MVFENAQITALFIRLIAFVILLYGVFPRLWHETRVDDDLKILRLIIFWGIVAFGIISVLLIHMNFCNIFDCISISITGAVSVVQAILVLNISIVLYLIYHQKY